MKQLSKFFSSHNYRYAYIVVALIAGASYYFMRQLFTDQSAWGFVMTSQLTFNIVILFGLWGALHNYIIKVKNPYLNMLKFVGGFLILVLLFRFVGGMKTVFG